MITEDELRALLEPNARGYTDLSVPPGWLDLVADCHKRLIKVHPDYVLGQVKEKFGGLRYYYTLSGATADQIAQVRDLVGVAEHASFSICEECGEPGEPFTLGGYVSTRCIEHRQAAIDRRKQVWEEGS